MPLPPYTSGVPSSGERSLHGPGPGRSRSVPEAFLQVVLDGAWDLFAVLEADGRTRYVSPSNYPLLGYIPDDLIGHNGFDLVHPDDRERLNDVLAQLRKTPDAPATFKHRFRAADGGWRVLETILQNKLDHPALRGWVLHSRDVTDRAELHAELAQARQHLRRLQLHPHFVLNVLHTIQAELLSDPDAAAETIAALGDLLRLSYAHVDSPMVTLGHEVDFVARYVDLHRCRFPGSIGVTFDVPDDLRSVLVPTLLLQPLVENALHHGLRPAHGGRLAVRARRVDGTAVCLTVIDDGVGLAAPLEGSEDAGIGLPVTRERLQRIYGNRATLRLAEMPEGGTVATIILPHADDPSSPEMNRGASEAGERT